MYTDWRFLMELRVFFVRGGVGVERGFFLLVASILTGLLGLEIKIFFQHYKHLSGF